MRHPRYSSNYRKMQKVQRLVKIIHNCKERHHPPYGPISDARTTQSTSTFLLNHICYGFCRKEEKGIVILRIFHEVLILFLLLSYKGGWNQCHHLLSILFYSQVDKTLLNFDERSRCRWVCCSLGM